MHQNPRELQAGTARRRWRKVSDLRSRADAIRIRRKLRETRILVRTGPVDADSAREVGGAVEKIVGRRRISQGPVRQLLTSPSICSWKQVIALAVVF